ncbi:hypothetical protein BJX61DRAFT_544176 [Aspergillus egyptiacus]|nr:hypothetical protein BJX61DRAFT_544176 [Aspergillus egyptiacus]
MPHINPPSAVEQDSLQSPTIKSKSSIVGPLSVPPKQLLSLLEKCITFTEKPGSDVPSSRSILPVVHLAWIVTVRTYAGENTFAVSGDYASGVCGVYDCDIPASKVVELNPEDSIETALRQLMITVTSRTQTGHASSRGHGNYNTMIRYGEGPHEGIASTMPPTTLRLSIIPVQEQCEIRLEWDKTSISPAIAEHLFHSFNQALLSIATAASQPLELVYLCSPHHLTQIAHFTQHISPFNNTLLHEMCLQHASTTPDAPAVVSWDGDLTYAELDDLTSRLAHHLVAQGVRPNTFVISCFQKSTWAIVSRLAILKAGGAYISIDARDPPAYLASIIRRANVGIMLSSPEYVDRFRASVPQIVEITPAFLNSLPVHKQPPCVDIQPDSPCLILFTSGSTGTPKGIIQEHRSYATSIADYVKKIGLNAHSRVFQFDDYAFDISNNDYLATLTAGGCCCVPTSVTPVPVLRDNINALKANMSFLTPTVAIQLTPREVPTLETICIGGEPPSRDLIAQWAGHVRLINQYGMGEAATFCAYNDSPDPERTGIVGRAGCGAIWIANPATPEQLVPVGAVGEILIEGPHLARGYLDNVAARPDVGFLRNVPAWMEVIHPTRGPTRVYRSGDLGRYLADGTVEHLGRKDAMLKLNGYRVNSVEVECVLRQCLSEQDAVVVDILGTIRADAEPVLTAFVYVSDAAARKDGVDIDIQPVSLGDAIYPLVQQMRETVAQNLPPHMMPSLFLQVDRIPRTKSNKTDRRRLHMYGQAFYERIRPCATKLD